MDPTKWLNPDELQRVTDAIGEAEMQTSAEIKLVMVHHCWVDIQQKAQQLFLKHGLDKTELRNAVMILVVTADRQFLIYGDVGIDQKVGRLFWADVRAKAEKPSPTRTEPSAETARAVLTSNPPGRSPRPNSGWKSSSSPGST